MRFIRYLAAAAVVGTLAGCDADTLGVQNKNNPDRLRVLGLPTDVEALASSQYQQVFSAIYNNIAAVELSMMTMSFMNSSGLANNGMGPRSGIPRQPIDNANGNTYAIENFRDFRILTAVARTSSDIIARGKQEGFALPGGEANLNRLLGWAHFTYGVSMGYVSMVYDQAGIPRPTDGVETPPLEDYDVVNAYALAQLDSAQAYFSRPGTAALPGGWLNGPGGAGVSAADFVKLIRTYKARIRAGVARTPAERAAVAWTEVIADATNGITSDFIVHFSPSNGWDHNWMAGTLHFRDANWHQMTYYIIGMADVSGAYDAWLATPRDARNPFLIITPDLRFPQGATRAAQNDDRGGQAAPTGGKYFRNRLPGLDQSGSGWQNSFYDHYRFRTWSLAERIGPKPYITRAENDMLAAEGYIRTNNIAAAAALIDRTRVPNGLPALTGVVTTATQPVPGGSECVPRVPVGPTFTTTACGNILEAMKWEKRMETAYTSYGAWFFDARGWGDLPEGTPIQWPVPVQELNARRLDTYNIGGVGREGGSGPSTYGFGAGTTR